MVSRASRGGGPCRAYRNLLLARALHRRGGGGCRLPGYCLGLGVQIGGRSLGGPGACVRIPTGDGGNRPGGDGVVPVVLAPGGGLGGAGLAVGCPGLVPTARPLCHRGSHRGLVDGSANRGAHRLGGRCRARGGYLSLRG